MDSDLAVVAQLDDDRRSQVLRLLARAARVDGVVPLSEQAVLRLVHPDERVVHVLMAHDGQLLGYAQVARAEPPDTSTAELLVDPRSRRRGIGRGLAGAALAAAPDGRLHVWAHGDLPAAERIADHLGLTRIRTLWQLRRSLSVDLPPADLPTGVSVRTFRPGDDDRAWLALNARAFAGHPEQGRWTLEDLQLRMAEEWFDPAGFFLAERAAPSRLVGFHWTKVHAAADVDAAPVGEVYVLGVDPDEQGSGLGRALTVVGLEHLRALGLGEALLYVDADNPAAMRLYEGLGFARQAADVMFGN